MKSYKSSEKHQSHLGDEDFIDQGDDYFRNFEIQHTPLQHRNH